MQQFISRSLQPASLDPQPAIPVETPAAPLGTASGGLSEATATLLLALTAILALLALAAYLIRRFLLQPAGSGKRGPLLRVRARTALTPKASVALIEVPGKLLLVGITGNQVTALGEVPADVLDAPDATPLPATASFADTLERQTQATQADTRADDDTLLDVPQHIQRKVSRLKQL